MRQSEHPVCTGCPGAAEVNPARVTEPAPGRGAEDGHQVQREADPADFGSAAQQARCCKAGEVTPVAAHEE